ncbi:MAG: fatty acid desaturase [Deltaproteobacteria bacterium]|nr:fatty acid desaturase [Deltaproteobacteria bacterium]
MDPRRIEALGRSIVLVAVAVALGSLFFTPNSAIGWSLDIAVRTYATFVASVMAHEAVHGHLGRGRTSSIFGRLALIPACVPFISFRRSHVLHHAFTNEPGRDPDLFLAPRSIFEIPFRCVLLPHVWIPWLARRGRLRRPHVLELALSYSSFVLLYTVIGAFAGHARVAVGMSASLVLASILSWYPFGVLTHAGFSTGSPEERSHDFLGRGLFWLTFGSSVHRAHHLSPRKPWLDLLPFVRSAPAFAILRRDLRA